MRNCRDCGVAPGEIHVHGCDVERCPNCGHQLIGCDCVYEVCGIDADDMESAHPEIWNHGPTDEMEQKFDAYVESIGGYLPWTGEFPGSDACREFGWYSRWVEGKGWVRCEEDDEGAGPDLNRLVSTARWDREKRRWVR